MQTTQVVDQTLIAQEIEAQQRVSQFKEVLAGLRLKRINALQIKKNLHMEIRRLIGSRNNLLGMFKAEALKLYPELQGLNVRDILLKISAQHPLYDIWMTYKKDLDAIQSQITVKFEEFKTAIRDFERYSGETNQVLDSYSEFSANSQIQVPSLEAIANDVKIESSVTSVEDDSALMSEIPALELLDPQTADYLTLQAASLEPAPDMLNAAVEESTGFVEQNKRPLLIAGLALAAIYVLFGGKRS